MVRYDTALHQPDGLFTIVGSPAGTFKPLCFENKKNNKLSICNITDFSLDQEVSELGNTRR